MSTNPQQLGPYRITRKLGEGAMGAVYQGVNEETGQVVAVKLLPPALGSQRGFEERFESEIETLRRLDHPNIVRFFGFGEQDGLHFYTMELVDGRTLEDEIDGGRRFTWREIIAVGKQVCAALKHAHDRGIIHRDLKPANLMITGDGQIKLADFGIARLYGHTGMTAAGGPLGTATYMSPEQTDGSDVSPRSDLYSLGCVFYALMSGRPPFQADSLMAMLRMQKSAMHEPLNSRISGVPAELDLIINKLLEKSPTDRIPTAATLAKSLAGVEDAVDLRQQTVTDAPATPRIIKPRSVQPPKPDATDSPASRSRVAAAGAADVTLDSIPLDLADQDATEPGKADLYELADAPGSSAAPGSSDDPNATAASTGRRPIAPGSTVRLDGESDTPNATVGSTVYITSDEADAHDREVAEREQREKPLVIGTNTIKLVVFLVALALATKWYMTPPSADALAARIEALVGRDEPTDNDYLDAAHDVRELERYHSDDPRIKGFDFVLTEAQLIRDRKKLKIKANRMYRRGANSAIERTYLEAIAYLEVDPEIALTRLQAMVDLYNEPTVHKDIEIRKYLALAVRQIQEMQEKTAGYSNDHLQLIARRLLRAQAIKAEDPDEARKIAHAIVVLYGDKQWAQVPVDQARALLRDLD